MKKFILVSAITISLCATFVSCSADDDAFSTLQNPVEETGVLMARDSITPQSQTPIDGGVNPGGSGGGTGDDDIIPIKPPKKSTVLMARDSIVPQTPIDGGLNPGGSGGGTGDDDIIPIKPPKK